MLSWKGVNRLLKRSRSSLSSHVARWIGAQYSTMLGDRQMIKEHKEREARMEALKNLPLAQAKAEETEMLRMEEEEGQREEHTQQANSAVI